MPWLPTLALVALLLAPAAAQGPNLLANADLERASAAPDRPADWAAVDFGTGGTWAVGRDGGRSGQVYLVVRGADETQRSAWRQKVAWPADGRAVAVGGWYRTRGVAGRPGHTPSIRVLFHRALDQWDEIGLKQAFFPPADDWTEAKSVFAVPEGTQAVVVELLHWLSAGETQWDDAWLRPATAEERVSMALPPDVTVDREPVFGASLPYAPADGETAAHNPPPFRWLPSGREARYRLQVARDPAFAAPAVDLSGLEWAARMLEQPLASGAWHWRYGVDLPDTPTLWSRPRRFEVPVTATPWAYPGRESFAVPAARPRLFITADRLPEIRRRAAEGDLKSAADGALRWVAQHAGEALPAEPERLTSDRAARGPQYAAIFRATRPPMDGMETAALAYLLTGDAAAGAEARRRILHFFAWDPKGSTAVFHNDEPAMWVMMRGMRAYDWTHDLFTPEERARLEPVMRQRAADFYELLRRRPYENNPFESHAGRILGFLGEAALSFLPEWPEAREWLDYVNQIYWGVWPAWGQDDGGWNEGPGYWSAYMTFALHYVVALRQATGVDLSQRPFFRNTPYYRLYLTPPYSQMSPFGDGTQFLPHRDAATLYWFSTLTRDPVLRWYPEHLGQGGGGGILGVVLKDDSLQGEAPLHLPQARLFPGVGLAVLHTDFGNAANDVQFSLRSTPYGAVSHGHNDQNTFVLEAFGEPLAVATGHYPYYGSPHHDRWTRQTKARQGITTDGGVGQDRGYPAQGRIDAFLHGEAFDLVVGDATQAYGGRLSQAVREVVHVRPGLFVVHDRLASDQPRRFEYWLHALDRMEVDEAAAVVTTRRPMAVMRTHFVEPRALAFTQTDQYDPQPEQANFTNTWHLTAATREPATATAFLTVLAPTKTADADRAPQVKRLANAAATGVEVTFADGSRTVVGFRRDLIADEAWVLGGLATDGRLAAVTFAPDGSPRGWLLHQGRRLSTAAGTLVEATEAGDLTAGLADDGGRIDAAGPGGAATVAWPWTPAAVTRGEQTLPTASAPLKLSLAPGSDQVQVWREAPVAPGPVAVEVVAEDRRQTLTGRRYGRGRASVAGRLDLPAGAWRLPKPAGVEVTLGSPGEGDLRWIRPGDALTLSGRNLPPRLELQPVLPAETLPARPQRELPEGLTVEAERGYQESGGAIQISGGTHQNVSGGDNLWGWNTAGHRLTWDLAVPEAGRWEVWLVGATETGLLAEVGLDPQRPSAVWFARTPGWGRTNADDWRAYRVASAELTAGRHRLAITNWSGMGLNVDRIVLVRAR